MKGRVVIVAGSDSGGGAGIQADIKTVTALGGFAATAVTALTAQNTRGIAAIMAVPAEFVRRQLDAVLSDIGADCIKTGMLASAATVNAVADAIAALAPGVPLVVDPVLVASSGKRLLDEDAVHVLKRHLVPMARVLTPNIPEAETLTGLKIADRDGMRRAGEMLVREGAKTVMVKGGHLPGTTVCDIVVEAGGSYALESPRIETRHTHGTGCTLASGIATGLAQGMTTRAAIERARKFLLAALATAPGYGQGRGPLNHAHTVREER